MGCTEVQDISGGPGIIRDVIDGFIRSAHNIFVRGRNIYEIIVSRVVDILTNFLQLEMHCLGCILHTCNDKGKGRTYVVE